MTRTITVLTAMALALQSQPAVTGHEPLRATVRSPKIWQIVPSGDDRMTYFVNFEAAVKNDRSTEIRVPSQWVCVPRAELRVASGEWKTALDAFCVDVGSHSEQCSVVPPGASHTLPKVAASFYLEEPGGRAPSTVTVRFHLITYCKEGTATVSERVLTEPVGINLPATPEK